MLLDSFCHQGISFLSGRHCHSSSPVFLSSSLVVKLNLRNPESCYTSCCQARSHGRARPLGILGAGDKKSPLTSTTALRAVELCWVHSDSLSS
ncbi:uncharacterized protein LOC110840872 isoform X2 [Zootermopsis nevadensis]|uniref:uncharacterized protein LOC110840872 isoform X2 n=1 Tax=Zootermopsis nevadensis TaxID=136037 RepID=UPI000B8E8E88|nr:uncharacterized protein LOC110840872 isoform X2 [Zootermopsis nevadensis]